MPAKCYVIIGAGAAGLSLCHALLERGVTEDIVVLDQKKVFADDRTWCFWDTAPHPYSNLTSECWHRWDVFRPDGLAASSVSPRIGYACLRGQDFYRAVLETIERHPNVILKLNHPIDRCEANGRGVLVSSGGEEWQADYVFDSRPRPVPPGGLTFSQHFFGQFVRSETSVFDPSRCTLMDFRVPQENGLHFVYILPFSPTEALVENTYIQSEQAGKRTEAQHRSEISSYLAETYGLNSFIAEREEAGTIPMTTQQLPKRDGRTFFIGTAGGCSKPSSGYTFTRIQDQCRQIADAAASGMLERFHEKPASPRYRFFDTVFLQALKDNPDAFPGYFHRLFSRVPPEALTAFLSETSTWRSDLSILRSLPLKPFLSAALRAVRHL